jgi:hypothetical protein
MRTYYIVEERSAGYGGPDSPDALYWTAHYGLFARLGWWSVADSVSRAGSHESADDCERRLRKTLELASNRYRIVRVVQA